MQNRGMSLEKGAKIDYTYFGMSPLDIAKAQESPSLTKFFLDNMTESQKNYIYSARRALPFIIKCYRLKANFPVTTDLSSRGRISDIRSAVQLMIVDIMRQSPHESVWDDWYAKLQYKNKVIRNDAFNILISKVNLEKNPQTKLEILEHAKKQPLYNAHRYNGFFSKRLDTETYTQIEDKIKDIKKNLKA
jgi:hypothetical protein